MFGRFGRKFFGGRIGNKYAIYLPAGHCALLGLVALVNAEYLLLLKISLTVSKW
jgi:hypothetical protein